MAADQPNTERAALMRLRDEFDLFFDKDKVRPYVEGGDAYNAACLNHKIRVRTAIDRELAALPADEAAGASAGLVEAASRLLRWIESDGRSDPLTYSEVADRLRVSLAAERARKPDDRDALRASLESLVRAVKRRRRVKQARHLEWLEHLFGEAEALALAEKVLKP